MSGHLIPLAATPFAALFPATTIGAAIRTFAARDLPGETLWLVEIAAPTPQGAPRPAIWGMVAAVPVASIGLPPDPPSAVATVRVSDRGWIGEPTDPDAPNQLWPARLVEPPAIEQGIPIYPGTDGRSEVSAGEITLTNADGGLDSIAGDWALSGLPVNISRGPHQRPRHALRSAIGRVATMRVAAALSGGDRLRLVLQSAGADLAIPANALYAGTGGAEGAASLKGQAKPRLYGRRRAVPPVLVDTGRLIYQINDGPMQGVVLAQDRGVRLTAAGNVLSYAALEAATVGAGTYQTCLSSGHIRLGSTPSLVTVDAQGDALGGYALTGAQIAVRLLTGPGGQSAGVSVDAFARWPTGDAGLWVQGGTVAQALGGLASGLGGWWGADAFGIYRGGLLTSPDTAGVGLAVQPWMLRSPPVEESNTQPPFWRVRVAYQTLDRLLTTDEVAGGATSADRDFLTQADRQAVALSLATQAAFRGAVDAPVFPSVLDAAVDADAMAARMLALFGTPRRAWRVRLAGAAAGLTPEQLEPGALVSLTWPVAGLSAGRSLVVRDLSVRGDVLDTVMWG